MYGMIYGFLMVMSTISIQIDEMLKPLLDPVFSVFIKLRTLRSEAVVYAELARTP